MSWYSDLQLVWHRWKNVAFVTSTILLIAAQCSIPSGEVAVSELQVSELRIQPASGIVTTGEEVTVWVEVRSQQAPNFIWSVNSSGQIIETQPGNRFFSISFDKPGDYTISLDVVSGDQSRTPQPVTITVNQPTPTSTSTLTPTNTPSLTPTNTPIPSPTHTPTVTPTGTRLPTNTPSPTPIPQAVVVATGLNMRSGPGIDYDIVDFLENGEVLDIQGRIANNEWIQVTSVNSGISGWVSARSNFIQINNDLSGISIITSPLPPSSIPTPTVFLLTQAAPILIDPQPFASQLRRAELEWDWVGTLGADEYFQVEIRNRLNAFSLQIDETVSPIDVVWVKNSFYLFDVIDEAYDREYTWRVVVVRGTPSQEKPWSTPYNQVWDPASGAEIISDYSEMRTFFIEPGDKPPPEPSDGGVCTRC